MIGQGITLFGSSLVYFAVMWYITLQTQSGLMMMFIMIAGMLPIFLISPLAGVWADRYNKKYLINISDAFKATITLVMAIMFTLGYELIGLLLVCLAARAVAQGVQMPTVMSLVPELVPDEHLVRINGINSSIQTITTFALFTILAGAATAALGLVGNFWIYTLFMLLGAGFLNMRGAVSMSMLQLNIDREYMGRCMSLFMMMASLNMQLGMLLWGPLSDIISLDWLILGSGVFILLMGIVIFFNKSLRKAGMVSTSSTNDEQ
jgi:MFS family permease